MKNITAEEESWFDLGLAVLHLTFAEWETSKDYTREEVVEIGKMWRV